MIDLGNYACAKTPVITRVRRTDCTVLNYIGKTNGCDKFVEPWKCLAWSRTYENGKPLPAEFAGKLPDDANMRDAFLYSFYDQATVEQILQDAKNDPDIHMMLALKKAEEGLWHKRFSHDDDD